MLILLSIQICRGNGCVSCSEVHGHLSVSESQNHLKIGLLYSIHLFTNIMGALLAVSFCLCIMTLSCKVNVNDLAWHYPLCPNKAVLEFPPEWNFLDNTPGFPPDWNVCGVVPGISPRNGLLLRMRTPALITRGSTRRCTVAA